MTIKDAYLDQYKKCLKKDLQVNMDGYYQTNVEFGGNSVYVSPDGKDVVRYVFNVNGCKKTKVIKKGNYTKKITFHKDKLPVAGTITKNNRFKKFIYKYVLFLKCCDIVDIDLIKLYVLKCINTKFEFRRLKKSNEFKGWEVYNPDYEDMSKMVDGLISAAVKKDIDDKTREQFKLVTRCVVNPITVGNRKKTKSEILVDAHKACRLSTDMKIKSIYNPDITDEENAENIGISVRRFKEWKKENVESPKDRIKRLYDPSKSVSENAVICNVSESSIQRYKRSLKQVEEVKEEVVDEVNVVDEFDDLDSWINSVLEDSDSDHDYYIQNNNRRYERTNL